MNDESYWTVVARELLALPADRRDALLKDFDQRGTAAVRAEMARLGRATPGQPHPIA